MELVSEYAVLQFAFPTDELWPIAILLLVDDTLKIRCRTKTDLETRLVVQDAHVVGLLLDQLCADARQASGRTLLAALEQQLSNQLRISERRPVDAKDIDPTLEMLSSQYLPKSGSTH